MFSMGLSSAIKNDYEVFDDGQEISSQENLAHGKKYSKGKKLEIDYIQFMKKKGKSYPYLDKSNLEQLLQQNYDGKELADLSSKEIEQLYQKRIQNIQEELDGSKNIHYTAEEKQRIIKKAKHPSIISMEYAEGWKNINGNMGKIVMAMIIISAIILIQLFGNDPLVQMKQLYRSTRYGKWRLDRARVILAYLSGIFLYATGMILFVVVMAGRFGLSGADQPIQSNTATFFSVYDITYGKQFLLNLGIGLLALILMISLTLFVSILADGIMTSGVIIAFFWILLLLFEQMKAFIVDHKFSNFMPLKMVDFQHYYINNELYRIMGHSITSLQWVGIVSGILSVFFLLMAVIFENKKLKNSLT